MIAALGSGVAGDRRGDPAQRAQLRRGPLRAVADPGRRRRARRAAASAAQAWSGEGLRYVRSRPDLLLVLGVMAFVGTFGLNFQLTSALMATEVYDKGAGEYGILGSTMALGSIAGALLAARREPPRLRLVVVAALAFGVAEIVIALMPTYLTFVAAHPAHRDHRDDHDHLGEHVHADARCPAALRGRVMALYLMVFMGGHAVRVAARRLGRRDVRRPLVPHRRRARVDRRHPALRRALPALPRARGESRRQPSPRSSPRSPRRLAG